MTVDAKTLAQILFDAFNADDWSEVEGAMDHVYIEDRFNLVKVAEHVLVALSQDGAAQKPVDPTKLYGAIPDDVEHPFTRILARAERPADES